MAFAFDFTAVLAAAAAATAPALIQSQPSARASGLLTRRDQRVGLALTEKALAMLAPKGSESCLPVMRTLDVALARPGAATPIAPAAEALSEDARLILRARCGACVDRCATPLL